MCECIYILCIHVFFSHSMYICMYGMYIIIMVYICIHMHIIKSVWLLKSWNYITKHEGLTRGSMGQGCEPKIVR